MKEYLVISSYFSNRGVDLYQILLMQVTGKDKDYRYMATSDLLNDLRKYKFKADNDLDIKISKIVLKKLDDVAGDMSRLAVKWFGVSLLFKYFLQLLRITVESCLWACNEIKNNSGNATTID